MLLIFLSACDLDLSGDTGLGLDADGDGAIAVTDCDDADALVFPGALEICNSVDDDCDGDVDEGLRLPLLLDADEDGWGTGYAVVEGCPGTAGYAVEDGDCDDADATTNPGATEVCNGTDDDCDGLLDGDDAAEAGAWYDDADGDGYGDSATAVLTCEPSATQVTTAGDCDDGMASTHPGATERCNDADDDCDGAVDEEASDALTWHPDRDGDGYGDPDAAYVLCGEPEGLTLDAADCDDEESWRHPGAVEKCDNHFADDCDEDDDGEDCRPNGEVAAEDADEVFRGEDAWDYLTTFGLLDVDGDGTDELLLAESSVLYRMGRWDTDLSDASTLAYEGGSEGAVDVLGDIDGDGVAELAVTGWEEGGGYPDPWRVDIVAADAEGTVWDASRATILGDNGFTGLVRVAAGDMDGDGDRELLVADSGATSGAGADDCGRVALFAGPIAAATMDFDDARAVFEGEEADNLGEGLATGDIDGDGLNDVVIGMDGGDVFLVYGAASLPSGTLGAADADAVLTGATTGPVDLGDFDGDGRADLAVADDQAYWYGAARVYFADASGIASGSETDADTTFASETEYVSAVRTAGDIDGDGAEDLVVTALHTAAWLFYDATPASLTEDDAGLTLTTEADGWAFSVGAPGDFDADGYDDLCLDDADVASDAGAAYLFYGGGI